MPISWTDFEKIDIRVGTIVEVNEFPLARKPAYQLRIDFGEEIGIKKSSAQITFYYAKAELINKKIIGIVNFSPKQIGPFVSECLVLGVYDHLQQVILIAPEMNVSNGAKIG